MRVGGWAVTLGIAALLLVGCGGDGEQGATGEGRQVTAEAPAAIPPDNLSVVMAGQAGPETAGLAMANHLGYFADKGLVVSLGAPASPLAPIGYVRNEVSTFGFSHQPQVEMATEKGAPLVTIGSVIPKPTTAMIWLKKSKIGGIADLKGKTIAIPGLPFQWDLLEVILEEAGLTLEDVKIKTVEYRLLSSLIEGKADAIFGGYENVQGIELEMGGFDPVVTSVSELGVPPYEELVLFARADFVSAYPQVVRGFMSAVRRGTAAAIKHPKVAARAIKTETESNAETTLDEMEAEVDATLPLLAETIR